MRFFLLIYHVVDDYIAQRAQYRNAHLELAGQYKRRGELILGGALADPVDRAVLVFRVPDRAVVDDFIRSDPYVINKLVTKWEVRPWTVVVGGEIFDTAHNSA